MNEQQQFAFAVGDVVTLKTGGPRMTVVRLSENGDFIVQWFGVDDKLETAFYSSACLVKMQWKRPSSKV